jgi:hypothetical protein
VSGRWALDRVRSASSGRTVVWLLLGLGALLRLRAYLFDRSLWLDEAALALNITGRPFGRLLQPLDFDQVAPLGFLFVERGAVTLFGRSEYALRLFPLLCGIASLFLFWKLAERVLSAGAAAVAVGLFAVADRLIYYSSETKPYSTDVAIGLLVWWVVAQGEGPAGAARPHRWWVTAVVGAIAIWFSHPVVFILAGIGLHWGWVQVKEKEWGAFGASAVTGATWLASFAGAYVVSLRSASQSPQLQEFWGEAAAPLLPVSLNDLRWYVGALARIAALPLGSEVGEVVAFAAILGGVVIFLKERDYFFRFMIPGWLALAASGLHTYPLANRLWLFMIPALLILVAAGMGALWTRTRSAWPLVGLALGGLLVAHPTLYAAYHLARPQQVEETRPLVRYIQQERQGSDSLYLYYGSRVAARYYAERGLIQLDGALFGVSAREDLGAYLRSLDALRGKGRVWFLFSHVNVERGLNEEELAVLHLDAMATRLTERRRQGATVYLYDLGR